MPLDPVTFLTLAAQCAPAVAPATLLAVAQAESGLDPLAIGVNGPSSPQRPATSPAEAAARARALVAGGRDIDLGLGQINVRNLARLGLTVEQAFEPCRNLAASARVLVEGYRRGRARAGEGQAALRMALSYYNTGHPERGLRNGYVGRVVGRTTVGVRPVRAREAPPLPAPAWDPFARGAELRATATFVITPTGATP